MPEDMKVYDRIVEAQDALFRLQQQMHGCDIVHFAGVVGEREEEGY
jgi:hypothetical protein